jgi:hypothetical protein
LADLLADRRRGRLRGRRAAEAGGRRGHPADGHRDHLARQPLLRRGDRGAVPACLLAGYRAYLPPRNAYILLHQTVYFSGHGTTEALTILLVYLVVAGLILSLLDWFRSEPPVPADATEAAAMAVPIGATP